MGMRVPRFDDSLEAARRHAITALQTIAFGRTRPTVSFDSEGPVLLLSPHPDDAVLNCCSVLMSDADVRVVNVFTGIPPPGFVSDWDRVCGAQESAQHVRGRIAEDEAVLSGLGTRPVNLPFLDIQYGLRRLSMKTLDRAVAQSVPVASLAYAPAALGEGHVDHRLVRSYARALAGVGVPVRLYADVPYAVRTGWPAWVREGGSADGTVPRKPRPFRKTAAVHVVTLDPEAAERKLRAMQAYTSQFAALDDEGRLTDPATHRHEVFWTLAAR
jgi:LmbE family N-acetylglucosaminyl deacetylase